MITGDLNLGNVLANFVIIGGPVLYFGNRWIKARERVEDKLWEKHDQEIEKREKEGREIRADLTNTTAQIAANLEAKHVISTNSIIEKISGNKEFYTQTYEGIKCSIDKLADHVATANGRTGKLEAAIAHIDATCKARSEVFYEKVAKVEKKKKPAK